MSEGTSWDKVKRYLPPDEEIDQALAQALKAEESRAEAGGTAPTLQTVRENTLVKGKVVGSQEDKVLIDIHHKADAVIPLAEFGDRAPPAGTEIEAWVMAMENDDGQVVLSVREAQRRRIFEDVVAGSEKTVRGRISEAVKGGLVVDIGVRAFLPAKELELRFVEDLTPYVGREFDFRVIEVDRMQKRVILSRRVILAEERAKKREALFATLAPGQVVKGVVSNMTDFGAFVDIGGAEGLIHKGDLAWARVAHPSEVLKLGEEVQVQVLTFDRHSGKISLGLKQAGPSPWDSASIRYAVGNRMKGRVVGLLEFGAVVEFEPGVQGLVHVSEMSWNRRVRRPADVVALNDEIEVEVIQLDIDKRKLGLSIKRIEENPWASLERRYPFATVIEGAVADFSDFGAFIRLDDGVEGLVHISELSWTKRYAHAKDALQVGQRVKAIVLGSDAERQRLSLSIRNLEPDPWWDAAKDFPVGSTHKAKITRFETFGAFAELRPGLEGLIHISRLGVERGKRPQDAVSAGQVVDVQVLEVSEENRRASLARLIHDEEVD